jgi:cytochrome P450
MDGFFLLDLIAGFLIPKGWKVMPLFRNIHHSPGNFKDPQMFDASRFKVMQVLLPFFPPSFLTREGVVSL